MAATETILFSSVFTVRSVDKNGKKFDKGAGCVPRAAAPRLTEYPLPSLVSRLECDAETAGGVTVVFDIHSELYPMREGETFTMALARTIQLDGKQGQGVYDQSGNVRRRLPPRREARNERFCADGGSSAAPV